MATADEQAVIDKHRQDTIAFNNAEGVKATHSCGECDNPLVIKYSDEAWVAVCGTDDSHIGWRKEETAVDVYRSGGGIEPYVKTHIERARPPVHSVDVMAGIFKSRQARLTDAGAYQAALFAMQVGLDPRFGEVAVIEFGSRNSDIKTPVVMITEDGWGRLAARELPGLYDRRPVLIMVTDAEERAVAGAKQGDFVAKAAGRLVGDKELDLSVRVSYGIYKATEFSGEHGNPVAKQWPANQARVRAARHWFEENCDGAVSKARSAWDEVAESMDATGIERVLEAEFRVLAEAPEAPALPAKEKTPHEELFPEDPESRDAPPENQGGHPRIGAPQKFENIGALLNYYKDPKTWGMSRSQVEEVTGPLLPSSDLGEAYAKLRRALEPPA